jgi:glycerol kinase
LTTHILALDQGTTSSRSIVFGADGQVVAVAQREFTQHFPRSGWVEHDPEEIWATQAATIAEVLARARLTPADVAAIGITNQRETTVLWERATGRPVARALVWQDRRTAAACAALAAAGHEPEIMRRTGLVLDPYFSATKLAWLLDSDAGLRARAERGELAFGTIDSWLVWNLTGGAAHVIDVTNASRTLLLDIASGRWDPWLLELFRIPAAVLPRVVPSLVPRDALAARIAGREIPIGGIAGDQQAALFGQACFDPGMAKNTYGTGCFLLMNTGFNPQFSSNRLLTTVAWDLGRRSYALEGSVFTGGAVVQWLRDGLGLIKSSSEGEALASSVPDTGGVCVVPAFTGLGSPHWDPHARGAILGLSRGTTRAHIARAALESIAFQSAKLLAAMQADARAPVRELRVDGGAARNDLLLQFQADLLGVPVVRPSNIETTAQGAANLAGLSVGLWRSTSELAASWRADRQFDPAMSRDTASAHLARWARAVERALHWDRAQD